MSVPPQMDTLISLDSDYYFERPAFDNTRSQIRLLRIAREEGKLSHEHPIRCSLTVHDLTQVADKYTAISYTWGSKAFPQTVEINGQNVRVRYNCWYALWHMRLHNLGQAYWIDSICIDQERHAEKQQQVRHMGFIYSQAKTVAACIGETGPGPWLYENTIFPDEGLPLNLEASLLALSERSYFSRVWTVQECVLAKEVRVFCGGSHVSLSDLASQASTIISSWMERPQSAHVRSFLSFLDDFGGSSQPDWSHSKQTVLRTPVQISKYFNRECQYPRDKLYGVMSLLGIEFRQRISIDYSKDLSGVLEDFANACPFLITRPLSELYGLSEPDTRELHLDAFRGTIHRLHTEFLQASSSYDQEISNFVERRLQQHRSNDPEIDSQAMDTEPVPAIELDFDIYCEIPAASDPGTELSVSMDLEQPLLYLPNNAGVQFENLKKIQKDKVLAEARPGYVLRPCIEHPLHAHRQHQPSIHGNPLRLPHMKQDPSVVEANDNPILRFWTKDAIASFRIPTTTIPGDILLRLGDSHYVCRQSQDHREELEIVGHAYCLSISSFDSFVPGLESCSALTTATFSRSLPCRLHLPAADLLLYFLLHEEEADISRLIGRVPIRTARLSVDLLPLVLATASRNVIRSRLDGPGCLWSVEDLNARIDECDARLKNKILRASQERREAAVRIWDQLRKSVSPSHIYAKPHVQYAIGTVSDILEDINSRARKFGATLLRFTNAIEVVVGLMLAIVARVIAIPFVLLAVIALGIRDRTIGTVTGLMAFMILALLLVFFVLLEREASIGNSLPPENRLLGGLS